MIKIKYFVCYIFLILSIQINSQDLSYLTKIDASDRGSNDIFGINVSISGNYAIVGAVTEDEDADGNNTLDGAGSAYIFEVDTNGNWVEVQKLVASDRAINDNFGLRVAISGNYAVVSSPLEDEDENGLNTIDTAGSVYIFERDIDGVWSQVQKIVASDRAWFNIFGTSLAFDGETLIVGAAGQNEGVYVFERDINGIWNETEKLLPVNSPNDNDFGYSVSLHENYAIIGAINETFDENVNNALANAGAAYIFERDINGDWNQGQKILALDRSIGDGFGFDVSIFNDFAVIGTRNEDEDINGNNFLEDSGSAYIFKRDINGIWNQTQKLVPSDRDTNDHFGSYVTINDNFLIVGAPDEDHDINGLNPLSNSGSAYIFEKDITDVWNEVEKITSPVRNDDDYFGGYIASDGNYVIIGDPSDDEDEFENNSLLDSGSAYIFKLQDALNVINSDLEMEVKIYPNPTSKNLHVKLEYLYEFIELTITNSIGQVLQTDIFEYSDLINLELNDSSGVYFIKLKTSKGNSKNFRIIKI